MENHIKVIFEEWKKNSKFIQEQFKQQISHEIDKIKKNEVK